MEDGLLTYQLDDPGLVFKATPHTEGDRRIVYCEPSTEARDQQREKILRSALVEAAPHFLKFGNIDTDHATMLWKSMGLSPDEGRAREIGLPLDVLFEPTIVVKAEIYRGDSAQAREANYFWSTLTELSPPKRWYPSVAGRNAVRDCDDDGCVIRAFKWVNLAFAKEPVNQAVRPISLGLDAFAKAITAGYGTDSAALAGGAALRRESLHPHVVRAVQGGEAHHRKAAADYLRGIVTGACAHARGHQSLATLIEHFTKCAGLAEADARQAATTLLAGIAARRNQPAQVAA